MSNYLISGYSQNLVSSQESIDNHASNYIEEQIGDKKNRLNASVANERGRPHRVWDTLPHRIELIFGVLKLQQIRRPFMQRTVHESVNIFRDVLLDAKKKVEGWGGQLYFVYLPQWSRYKWIIGSDENSSKRHDVITMVDSLGIDIIDFHQIIRQEDNPLALFPFEMAGHYNKNGYQLLAKQIAKHLVEGGLPLPR